MGVLAYSGQQIRHRSLSDASLHQHCGTVASPNPNLASLIRNSQFLFQ
jgi:hypothetical protein